MAIQPGSSWSPYSMNSQSSLKPSVNKGFNLKSSASAGSTSSSGSSGIPLLDTFNDILQEAVTGLTQVVGQVASNKVSKFVSHHDKLGAIAQAAGWAPATGSSASSTSNSSSASSNDSSSAGAAANNPITRLMDALGQTVTQTMQQTEQSMIAIGGLLVQQIQANLAAQLNPQPQENPTDQTS